MTPRTAYADDIYLWSQEQAALLRALPGGQHNLPNALDLETIAEEIESVGRSELSTVQSCLTLFMVHLIKLAALGLEAQPSRHWIA